MLIATRNATTGWQGRRVTRRVTPFSLRVTVRSLRRLPQGRRGNVYQVRTGLAKKPAIVVAESGEMLTLHVSHKSQSTGIGGSAWKN